MLAGKFPLYFGIVFILADAVAETFIFHNEFPNKSYLISIDARKESYLKFKGPESEERFCRNIILHQASEETCF